MPTQLVLQTPDPAVNDTAWQDRIGLFSAVLQRTGGAYPASLTMQIIADTASDSAQDPGKRFYPFLNVKLVVRNVVLPGDASAGVVGQLTLFVGRIDNAELVEEDGQTPRHWLIVCRDWLSVLQDNQVGPGLWRTTDTSVFTGRSIPGTFQPGSAYDGSYQDNWNHWEKNGGQATYGEYRRLIIADLALNIVNNKDARGIPLGLTGVTLGTPPNSKRINFSVAQMGQMPILAAIRQLAATDPWANNGGGEVDGQDITNAVIASSGFGGEFQIAPYADNGPPYYPGDPDGRHALYYRRGGSDSGALFSWQQPPAGVSTPVTHYVISYNFARDGADIYSRVSPNGKNDAKEKTPSAYGDGGQGVIISGMEQIWSPSAGQFRVRREPASRSQTTGGDSNFKNQTGDEKQIVQARTLNDNAYANLLSGTAALSNDRGGINQGTVVVTGPPLCAHNPYILLLPGFTCSLNIPHLGILLPNPLSPYTMDTIKYEWPADRTTVTVSRTSSLTLRKQLYALLHGTNDAAAGHSDVYTSLWFSVDGTGKMTWTHNISAHGSQFQVEAAYWDGTTMGAGGTPLPTLSTNTVIPDSYFDAAQGQNVGKHVSKHDQKTTVVLFNKWLCYSDGAVGLPGNTTGWLAADDTAHTVIRIKVWGQ